jgi:hypothetical protein
MEVVAEADNHLLAQSDLVVVLRYGVLVAVVLVEI